MAKSISDIELDANRSAGSRYWFSKTTMKAFNSIVYGETFDAGDGVTLFISSERDSSGRSHRTGEPMAAYGGKRMFTIRISAANGEIDTLGHVMQFRDKRKAVRVAEKVAMWWRTDTGLEGEPLEEWLTEQ